MTEMEFLQKEEERFNDCLKMHEDSAKHLKEEISAIRKLKEQLQGSQMALAAPADHSCER